MSVQASSNATAIAIVGVSALFPGSQDASGFWRDILQGRDLLTDVPASHWRIDDYYDPDPSAPDKTYARRGGFLSPIDFDALGWGIPPATLPATDTSQLLALIVAQAVLEDATREKFASFDRSRTSVILGVTSAQELLFSMVSRLQRPVWVKALRESGLPEDEVQSACDRIAAHYVPWQEASFPGLLGNVVAGRIANRLNLGGTNCVTDAACASTFSALAMAVNELQLGHSDLAIAGGVDTLNDIFMYMCFSKTPALSPTGDCRPFSDRADGTMLGEGLGMVALKRLDDAERDGDRIYAVLRGIGTGSDGRSKSVYAPVASGQARTLRRAYEAAGYAADTVELMEAHGTGTKAGDVAEFEGLRTVFQEAGTVRKQWCALGSVKSQIGHTKAAAGAAGLFKAVMAVHHKVLPPTIKIETPNPKLDIAQSPFYLNTQARPWIRGSDHPRRASVSAFGFGGSNFHITLEEYCGSGQRAERLTAQSCDLVLLSSDNTEDLLRRIAELQTTERPLAVIAQQSRMHWRATQRYRLAIVANTQQQLRERLRTAQARVKTAPEQAFELPDGSTYGLGRHEGSVAMLFPGQGSQYVGMGDAVAMQFDAARSIWDQAADLRIDESTKLHEVVFPLPVFSEQECNTQREQLTRTEWAQPAIGAHSLALLALLGELGIAADAYAGHSFGEIIALHAGGAFDAATALRIARRRGELMRDAARIPGAMTALRLPLAEVQALLTRHGPQLVVANHNAPQQVVVSGPLQAMQQFEAQLQQQGIAFMRLPVATAFHSAQVAACCTDFAAVLATCEVHTPKASVFGNQNAAPYPADPATIRAQLAAQIAHPVRFVETIEAMYARGVRTFIEVGPGAVLSGLVSNILDGRPHAMVSLDRKGREGIESLLIALARLAAAGIAMQASKLFADTRLPATASAGAKLSVSISGSNVGKPYPPASDDELPAPNPPRVLPQPISTVETRIAVTEQSDRSNWNTVSTHFKESQTMSNAPTVSNAWLQAFQESQQQAAAAHEMFQRTLAESHAAYLKLTESALLGLSGVVATADAGAAVRSDIALAGATSGREQAVPNPRDLRPADSSILDRCSRRDPTSSIPGVAPATARASEAAPTKASSAKDSRPVAAPAAAVTASSVTPALEPLLLAVVAEKTGYPVDMLQLDMDMEGDLGIDSIKRVEILAAVDERAPQLPKVDRARLSALHTLREIVDYLQASAPARTTAVVGAASGQERTPSGVEDSRPEAAPTKAAAVTKALPALEPLLLAVVAEKTGYPVDMLQLDMDMEGDLGIDSIKRVEILAAVDERAPHLPKVDRARLSALHTLREIVDYLQAGAPVAKNSEATVTTVVAETSKVEIVPPKLGRYVLERIPAPATGLAMPGLLSGMPIHVIGDELLAPLLAQLLRTRGIAATAVDTLPEDATACIYLGGLVAPADVDAAIAINRPAFQIARTLAVQLQTRPGLFVTVQDTGGSFALNDAPAHSVWAAGLAALIKTCALEWPRASVKAIDLDQRNRTPEQSAQAIADELLTGGGEIEVMLPNTGGRYTLRNVARAALRQSESIQPDDVVLVSGGARGVTAACLLEWAGRCRARFVLLGRTQLHVEPAECSGVSDEAGLKRALIALAQTKNETLTPSLLQARVQQILAQREIQRTLGELKRSGCTARYCAVAIEDRQALESVLAEVRSSWGPIRGIVHAAGVLADKRIAEKTDAQFDRVFDTKVRGLQALLAATASDPLRLLCVFSSVSARCGNTGQSDYAMANEVLAKVAWSESRLRPDLRVKSLGWGPWEGGMVTAHLKARFAALGVPMIPLAVGARLFADEMMDASTDAVELVLGGEPRAEALLFDGADARVDALEVRVQRDGHAWLEGHSVDGTPVVPMVLVAEWLTRAAQSFRSGLTVIALHDLKVLKGIRLDRFENGGDLFRIESQSVANASAIELQMSVRDGSGRLRYSARAELRATAASPTTAPSSMSLPDWQGTSPYAELLFHRDRFELIDKMQGISDEGVAAEVRGVHAANWPQQNWQLDVAALDGGMQLAVLYGQRMLGGPNLPTSIATIRHYAMDAGEGPITVSAHSRNVSRAATTTDIYFVAANGQRLAELLGVQNHALIES